MSGRAAATLAVLEATYAPEDDERIWLQAVCDSLREAFDAGFGVTLGKARIPPGELPFVTTFVQSGTPVDFDALARGLHEHLPMPFANDAYRSPGYVSMLFRGHAHIAMMDAAKCWIHEQSDIDDILGTALSWTPSDAIAVSIPVGAALAGDGGRAKLLWHVGAHLRCALRLRDRALAEDAVIEPGSGRVVHAEGAARDVGVRERLRAQARAMDRGRTAAGRAEGEVALAAWRGLVDGTWSMVDRFDRDGRRYMIAKRNPPAEVSAALVSKLTLREKQVAVLAATGASNKLIGYELGLAASTVATHLQRAARKLGVKSRVALCQVALAAWRALSEGLGGLDGPTSTR
ncbi:MAG: helix-turn-helix transcriptional regulator [Myxococcales bacterium]|nr:helix-turn-helix transcriptional regulator [Myxococcales bacterium]